MLSLIVMLGGAALAVVVLVLAGVALYELVLHRRDRADADAPDATRSTDWTRPDR